MSSNILISVIKPVHNTSKYLNTCIDSILKNDYKNIEIIRFWKTIKELKDYLIFMNKLYFYMKKYN